MATFIETFEDKCDDKFIVACRLVLALTPDGLFANGPVETASCNKVIKHRVGRWLCRQSHFTVVRDKLRVRSSNRYLVSEAKLVCILAVALHHYYIRHQEPRDHWPAFKKEKRDKARKAVDTLLDLTQKDMVLGRFFPRSPGSGPAR